MNQDLQMLKETFTSTLVMVELEVQILDQILGQTMVQMEVLATMEEVVDHHLHSIQVVMTILAMHYAPETCKM